MTATTNRNAALLALAALVLLPAAAYAHDISQANRAFMEGIDGPAFLPFFYLGAKHMVTGIDHVLYLIGVVFFLHRLKDVVLYVSMFTIGHSLTLMGGVLLGTGANSHIVDAIIGISVVYKAFENMGGFRKIGFTFDPRLAVLAFGLAHGLGLATKLMDLAVSPNGLLVNLIGFNLGVEAGQVIVLAVVVTLLNLWRRNASFGRAAFAANVLLMTAGLVLAGYQFTGYFAS
ncbi:MAG: hypothetical protein BGO57_04300 [Sphingomonadales bacterium 63-6]|nr:MAG: hypothetical protein BGO57_04300 [Sphingomonadales bacterium 63-6]